MTSAIDELIGLLGQRWVVATLPDYPNLFDGPDILAGHDGQLLAVFVPKKREITHPERLRARLLLTRLALPDHAWCVLVSEDPSNGIARLFGHDFHSYAGRGRASLDRAFHVNQFEIDRRKGPAAIRFFVQAGADYLFDVTTTNTRRLIETS